jgi:hypothetical protein
MARKEFFKINSEFLTNQMPEIIISKDMWNNIDRGSVFFTTDNLSKRLYRAVRLYILI